MDDPRLFSLLDDIAQTARGGVSNNFDEHQLLDNEPQYYVSQQASQSFHGDGRFPQDGRRDESSYHDEGHSRQPQEGSRHFQNHGSQVAAGLRLTVPSNNAQQASNFGMRPPQQQQYRVDDECMSSGPDLTQPRPFNAISDVNLSQYSFNGPTQQRTSSPPLSGLPSSPALRASQRRHDHRPNQLRSAVQHTIVEPSDPQGSNPNSSFQPTYHNPAQRAIALPHAPRLVQGIELRSTHELPDRFRSIFSFPNFNAVQSKCFDTLYRSNDNFVLSSPTGSGKTVAFELAICRLINGFSGGEFKIVYQAPTKSLCSERQRDWSMKFRPFDLECAELTGDTGASQLKNVQNASIIVTTPEKWDSMTRKWKDHIKLMKMIKLFLIDEVHMLKEERGAVLEVVVSRMKSIGSEVRFIALSASIPNSDDIATWLGRNPVSPQTPAVREVFGEEFRPVKLQKHVAGYHSNSNDFAFEKALDARLPEVISKYSHKKPIMVFCATRKSVEATAQVLANWWMSNAPKQRYWEGSQKSVAVSDRTLKGCVSAAVGFHHAGLSSEDRLIVEKGFLNGDINVICCTSTLAVGVNLPCHFVIIKNTCAYTNEGMKEYSDLEIMQMLGRAGRPQFDNTAVAMIMTRQEKVKIYEKMVSGQEVLESCLHRNLIDHLNAEIVLGTVTNLSSARKWLSGTFLYVRLREHPEHYRIAGDNGESRLEERLERIAFRDIELLQQHDFVLKGESKLSSTEFGEAMARYCVHFETAKHFLSLPPKAKMSEMLSALAHAKEFKEIRLRGTEKSCYKELNKSPSIKFQIPVNLDLPAHKISLVIQSQLGGVDLPTDEKTASNKFQYLVDVNLVFQHISRLIRCVVDFSLYREDSIALRNSLALCRSLGARCWDDSPLQLRQLERVGIVGVRKLVNAGIKSIEELENTEAHRIEMILKRAPPFGLQVIDAARAFPKPRVSVQMVGKPMIKAGQGATINLKADIGFVNEKVPIIFQKKAVYVVFLAETSDGHKVEFRRISAKRLNQSTDIRFSVTLTDPTQAVACYIMCDEFAGTLRSATLKPTIPSVAWPKTKEKEAGSNSRRPAPNSAKRRSETPCVGHGHRVHEGEFGDGDLDDKDLLAAMADEFDDDFKHIDDYSNEADSVAKKNIKLSRTASVGEWEPKQMANGKWACNHRCKNRTACKHMCCREGLDKPPKAPKKASGGDKTEAPGPTQQQKPLPKGQTTLSLVQASKTKMSIAAAGSDVVQLDLTQEPKKSLSQIPGELKRLETLRSKAMDNRAITTPTFLRQTNTPSQSLGAKQRLSFLLESDPDEHRDVTSDYGDSWPDSDLPDLDMLAQKPKQSNDPIATQKSGPQQCTTGELDDFTLLGDLDDYGDNDSLVNAAMVGLADSQELQTEYNTNHRSRNAESAEDFMTALANALQDTSATIMPDTPKVPRKIARKIPPISDDSFQSPLSPVHQRPRKGLFVDTSSDLFAKPGSTLPRGLSTNDVEFTEPFAKRVKTVAAVDNENSISLDRTLLTDHSNIDMIERNEELDSKVKREDIDAWFMQEFGQYVEFT